MTVMGWDLTPSMVGLEGAGVDRSELTEYTGPYPIPNGVNLDRRIFRGPVVLSGNNVISRSLWEPLGSTNGVSLCYTLDRDGSLAGVPEVPVDQTSVVDCEFSGAALQLTGDSLAHAQGFMAAYWGAGIIERSWIHHMGAGIGIVNGGQLVDLVVRHNVITDIIMYGDYFLPNGQPSGTANHTSCFSIRGMDRSVRPDRLALVENNRFELLTGNASGPFTCYGQNGRTTGVVARHNLIIGNNYSFNITPGPLAPPDGIIEDLVIYNNRLLPGPDHAPGYHQGLGDNPIFHENYRWDPNAVDDRGEAIPNVGTFALPSWAPA